MASSRAQTVQHRIDQAVTRFNILSNVLRTTNKFSARNRVRVYKCCVWASLRYGRFATGLNQAGFNRVVATTCTQLRKVLRIHEHGVSNQQVLRRADLDPMKFFLYSGSVLLERISADTTRPSEIRDIEEAAAEENLRVMKAILLDQPHSQLIEVDPTFVQSGCVCQTCGLTFANEAGLAMHVKSKHSEIHLKAGVEFNRYSHSLFGVPVCRLCRRHLHDWSSMAKHITAGTCPRLKDALAKGLSHDDLLHEVMEQEKLDPLRAPVEVPEVEDIGEYAEWMEAPIATLLQDTDLHRRLRSGCAICKQRLVGINRVKTHWQLSRKAAWDKINGAIRGHLRSLSSVFRCPCQFCGSRAKDASAHAVQCPVMYQALAIRELHRANGMADARREAQPTRPRQDKADPQYMRFDVTKTPLGRAFGWSSSSAGALIAADNTSKQASILQRPRVTESRKIATVRAPGLPLHGWSGRSRSSFSLLPGKSAFIVLCQRQCHGLVACPGYRASGGCLGLSPTGGRDGSPQKGVAFDHGAEFIPKATPGWSFGPVQQDAAEFSSHMLMMLEGLVLWQSRIEEIEGTRVTDRGTFLFLDIPTSPSTLQDLIEAWTFQHHVYGLTGEWPRVPVVLVGTRVGPKTRPE